MKGKEEGAGEGDGDDDGDDSIIQAFADLSLWDPLGGLEALLESSWMASFKQGGGAD